MKSPVTLEPDGIREVNNWSQLGWCVRGLRSKPFLLTHAVQQSRRHLLCAPDRGDHATLSVLLPAMRRKQDIVVAGKVSPRLLDNLEILQRIWNRWYPERYHIIHINAAAELPPEIIDSDRKAVFSFSGGVDASFSLFRHLYRQAGRNTHPPGAAMLVHGMDIPLERDDFFQQAAKRAGRMLATAGLPMICMKTNSRGLVQNWEDEYGLQLCACFLMLQGAFAWAVLGSGEPYENFFAEPLGSTPLTDPLCSTEAIQVIIDGCAFDRTEKVRWLSEHTNVVDDLRVCWAGPLKGENCSTCEKCIRTMLNFWAADKAIPSAFPFELTPGLIRSLRFKNNARFVELKTLYGHARTCHAYRNKRMLAIRAVLRRYAFMRIWKKLYRFLHHIFFGTGVWCEPAVKNVCGQKRT